MSRYPRTVAISALALLFIGPRVAKSEDGAPDLPQERLNDVDQESGMESGAIALLGCRSEPRYAGKLLALRRHIEASLRSTGLKLIAEEALRQRHKLSPDVVAAVDTSRERARAHFLAFEFDEALESLDRARSSLLEANGDIWGEPLLARVELERARVLQDLGRVDEELLAMYGAAMIQPGLEPEPNDYPPRLIETWSDLMSGEITIENIEVEIEPSRFQEILQEDLIPYVVSVTLRSGPEEGRTHAELNLWSSQSRAPLSRVEVELADLSSWRERLDRGVEELTRGLSDLRDPASEGDEDDRSSTRPTRLLILTTPGGARLVLDDVEHSEATPTSVDVAPGRHRVVLSREGFETRELDLVAWEGQTRPLEIQLVPESRRSWARSWWFWTLVGVVVTGATAGIATWGVQARRDLPDVRVQPIDR